MDSVVSKAIANFGFVLSSLIIFAVSYQYKFDVRFVAGFYLVIWLISDYIISGFIIWAYPSGEKNDVGEMIYAFLFGCACTYGFYFLYAVITSYGKLNHVFNSLQYAVVVDYVLNDRNILCLMIVLLFIQLSNRIHDQIYKINQESAKLKKSILAL